VLLPVKNAQSTLAATVQEILDVASELSEQIELLIIDDGSTDATSEVATELTRHFPQVRAICQGRSLGWEAAIHTGLQESTGKVVLIQEEGGVPLDEIVKTWKVSGVSDQLFFRKDAAESEAVKPVSLSPYAANHRKSQPWSERQSPVSSRPIRPNFLVKTRDNALGE
jgi:glycosyltransferase involved in cell wall biosynthesis